MKRFSAISMILLLSSIITQSCATIVSGSTQDIAISSQPSGAIVEIKDHRNMPVWSGTTPMIAELDRGAGFFRSARYTVTVKSEGHQDAVVRIQGRINGWYLFGNLFLGGWIGWLIVDPMTGAMYNLRPDHVSPSLARSVGLENAPAEGLLIVLTTDIPQSLMLQITPDLVPLN